MDELDWELEFESWEDHDELHERRDYQSLVALCELEVRRRPDDLHAAEQLADAYLLNMQYEKALEFTTKIHRECPDIPTFQHFILDALRALGKSEDEFDWVVRPTIIRLTSDFVNRCYDYLRAKRRPRPLHDLTYGIGGGDYLAFSDEELLQYLKHDVRFVVDGSDPETADIRVARTTPSRTKG